MYGTITVIKDKDGNDKYVAKSSHTGESLECWSRSGAEFWLWLWDGIIGSRKQRNVR